MSAATRAATALVATRLGSHVALARRHHKTEAVVHAKQHVTNVVCDRAAVWRCANADAKAAAADTKRATTQRRVEAAAKPCVEIIQTVSPDFKLECEIPDPLDERHSLIGLLNEGRTSCRNSSIKKKR